MPDFTTIKIQGGTVTIDMGDLFRRSYRASTDVRPLLKQVGVLMVASSQKSFVEQKRGEQVWPERGHMSKRIKNKALMLETANRGGIPPKRVFDERPALMSTTNSLFSSISFRLENNKTVVVGTVLPYATKQQNGGEIDIRVKPNAVAILREWALDNGVFGEIRGILRNKRYTSRIKPRTFVSIEKDDVEDILEATRRYFLKPGDGESEQ